MRLSTKKMMKLKSLTMVVSLSLLKVKADLIDSMMLMTSDTNLFIHFFNFYIIKAMLQIFFSIQHSKTACTVRGFWFTLDCRSCAQGVHHMDVAVELMLQLLLKRKQVAMAFLPRLLYYIVITTTALSECSSSCRIIVAILLEISMTSPIVVHHTIVAGKVEYVKWWEWELLINLNSLLYLYGRGLCLLSTVWYPKNLGTPGTCRIFLSNL